MPDRYAELRTRFAEFMRNNSLKKTKQRDAILDVFLQTEEHTSLDQLLARVQKQLPGVGYATVYRSMTVSYTHLTLPTICSV